MQMQNGGFCNIQLQNGKLARMGNPQFFAALSLNPPGLTGGYYLQGGNFYGE